MPRPPVSLAKLCSGVRSRTMGELETELRTAFDVREEVFVHADCRVKLILPRKADELIDESAFEVDERLPYWAELWPSARGLTRYLLEAEGKSLEGPALELGSGVALPALALRRRGVEVLATDWYPEALRFAEANAERNGLGPLRTAVLDWQKPGDVAPHPLVVAADVLYESRNAALLAELLPKVTAQRGRVLLADPGRAYVGQLLTLLRQKGWQTAEADVRTEPAENGTQSRVTVFELRRG